MSADESWLGQKLHYFKLLWICTVTACCRRIRSTYWTQPFIPSE